MEGIGTGVGLTHEVRQAQVGLAHLNSFFSGYEYIPRSTGAASRMIGVKVGEKRKAEKQFDALNKDIRRLERRISLEKDDNTRQKLQTQLKEKQGALEVLNREVAETAKSMNAATKVDSDGINRDFKWRVNNLQMFDPAAASMLNEIMMQVDAATPDEEIRQMVTTKQYMGGWLSNLYGQGTA